MGEASIADKMRYARLRYFVHVKMRYAEAQGEEFCNSREESEEVIRQDMTHLQLTD